MIYFNCLLVLCNYWCGVSLPKVYVGSAAICDCDISCFLTLINSSALIES